MPDQGEFDVIPNSSFLMPNDDYENVSSLADQPKTKRDVFDMTVWKLHTLNRPTRRDCSLRKSVLIFNLLRCLQRENSCDVPYDVDMPDSDSCSQNSDAINVEEEACRFVDDDDDDGMIDDELTDESDTSGSSDAETRSAVISLSMIDQEKSSEFQPTVNVTFQLSSGSGSSWNSVSCGAAEPDMMDIDQRNELSFTGISTSVSDSIHQRPPDSGLITESYRLLESGGCVLGDQNFQFGRNKSYAGAVTAGNGEYRPFDPAGGFNLFA